MTVKMALSGSFLQDGKRIKPPFCPSKLFAVGQMPAWSKTLLFCFRQLPIGRIPSQLMLGKARYLLKKYTFQSKRLGKVRW